MGAPATVTTHRSSGLWANAQSLRFGRFGQGEIQNSVLQSRRYFVRFDFGWQIHNAQDLVSVTLLAERLALFLFLLGHTFAGDGHPARVHAQFDFFFVETRYLRFHLEGIV